MSPNELENKVFAFFDKISKKQINFETSINNDLEFYGNDFDPVGKFFSEDLKVDFTGFVFDKYFVDELGIMYWYYKWFKPEYFVKPPLTIGHLIEVARRGHWFEPES
jgi:Protein of unknown function (DUF1493)